MLSHIHRTTTPLLSNATTTASIAAELAAIQAAERAKAREVASSTAKRTALERELAESTLFHITNTTHTNAKRASTANNSPSKSTGRQNASTKPKAKKKKGVGRPQGSAPHDQAGLSTSTHRRFRWKTDLTLPWVLMTHPDAICASCEKRSERCYRILEETSGTGAAKTSYYSRCQECRYSCRGCSPYVHSIGGGEGSRSEEEEEDEPYDQLDDDSDPPYNSKGSKKKVSSASHAKRAHPYKPTAHRRGPNTVTNNPSSSSSAQRHADKSQKASSNSDAPRLKNIESTLSRITESQSEIMALLASFVPTARLAQPGPEPTSRAGLNLGTIVIDDEEKDDDDYSDMYASE